LAAGWDEGSPRGRRSSYPSRQQIVASYSRCSRLLRRWGRVGSFPWRRGGRTGQGFPGAPVPQGSKGRLQRSRLSLLQYGAQHKDTLLNVRRTSTGRQPIRPLTHRIDGAQRVRAPIFALASSSGNTTALGRTSHDTYIHIANHQPNRYTI